MAAQLWGAAVPVDAPKVNTLVGSQGLCRKAPFRNLSGYRHILSLLFVCFQQSQTPQSQYKELIPPLVILTSSRVSASGGEKVYLRIRSKNRELS